MIWRLCRTFDDSYSRCWNKFFLNVDFVLLTIIFFLITTLHVFALQLLIWFSAYSASEGIVRRPTVASPDDMSEDDNSDDEA